VRALPRTYAGVDAPAGTAVTLTLDGAAGGAWTVVRAASESVGSGGEHAWELFAGRPTASDPPPAAEARMSGDTAWRLFTKGLSPDQGERRTSLSGDLALARRLLSTVAIIA